MCQMGKQRHDEVSHNAKVTKQAEEREPLLVPGDPKSVTQPWFVGQVGEREP